MSMLVASCCKEDRGFESRHGYGCLSVSCECCVLPGIEVSATGRSLVQRITTGCGVSEM
jgi:hypothetical protein